jgi:hypothetical protein
MMLPAVLLVGAGPRRRLWIPVPVILLWPFWLLAWVAWAPARLARAEWAERLRAVLILLAQLSGTVVDVKAKDGSHVRLRFV